MGHADEHGLVFASFDPTAHHVEPRVAGSRFGARLAPFPSREEATAALAQHGVTRLEELGA
jgi:hypothetical protein